MLTLWEAKNLPLAEVERSAYATDDRVVVSIKVARALVRRALRAHNGDAPVDTQVEDQTDGTQQAR